MPVKNESSDADSAAQPTVHGEYSGEDPETAADPAAQPGYRLLQLAVNHLSGPQLAVSNLRSPTRGLQPAISNPRPYLQIYSPII
ncbi:hypothetical protein ACOMHN_021431 [Nucella lapillus]